MLPRYFRVSLTTCKPHKAVDQLECAWKVHSHLETCVLGCPAAIAWDGRLLLHISAIIHILYSQQHTPSHL
jgi:hypothetical protein